MMENTLKSKPLDSVSKMEYFGYFHMDLDNVLVMD